LIVSVDIYATLPKVGRDLLIAKPSVVDTNHSRYCPMTSKGTAFPGQPKNHGETGKIGTEAASEHVHVVASSLPHISYWDFQVHNLRQAENGCSDVDYTKLVQCAERIPYLKEQTDHLKDLISKHRQLSASFAEWQKENDEEPRGGEGRNKDARRQRADAAERRADASERETTLSLTHLKILSQVISSHYCARNVHWKVHPLTKLIPPEVTTEYRSASPHHSDSIKDSEDPEERYLPARVMSMSYDAVRDLCDEAKLLFSGIFSETALQATCEYGNLSTSKHVHSPDSLHQLKRLSDVFNNAIEKSKILSPLPHGDQQRKEKRYVDAIETFLTRFDDAVSSNSTERSWFTARNCFPGSVHQENDGVYKVLAHLLRSVGAIVATSKPSTSMHPQKRKTMKDPHPVTTGFAAAVICMRGPHHALIIRDDAMDIMVRMKAGQGTQRGPLDMIDEQREQLLSHLGDHVERVMDFGGGVGVPTFVTGVIMGLAHVQILQLHFLEAGTPESRLELHASRLLPLMTKENFQRWYKSNTLHQKFASQWEELTMFLYPAKDVPIRRTKNRNPVAVLDKVLMANSEREYIDDHGILLGWKALLSVMTASAQDLTEAFDKENGNLGRMIGGGAYANAFQVSANRPISRTKKTRPRNEISLIGVIETI